MAELGLDTVDFVTVGIECTLRQLLESGFFHAGTNRAHLPPALLCAARACSGLGLLTCSCVRPGRVSPWARSRCHRPLPPLAGAANCC